MDNSLRARSCRSRNETRTRVGWWESLRKGFTDPRALCTPTVSKKARYSKDHRELHAFDDTLSVDSRNATSRERLFSLLFASFVASARLSEILDHAFAIR